MTDRSTDTFPHYEVDRQLPDWLERGHTQFQTQHAGPAEVAKGMLTRLSVVDRTSDHFTHDDGIFSGGVTPRIVWNWTTNYSDQFLNEMQSLGKTLIQVNWSCGFSTRSEAIQREIVIEFTRKAHARGMRISAYLSLTNIFWKDALRHDPHFEELLARNTGGRTTWAVARAQKALLQRLKLIGTRSSRYPVKVRGRRRGNQSR